MNKQNAHFEWAFCFPAPEEKDRAPSICGFFSPRFAASAKPFLLMAKRA